jgi:DNA-binding XRE family transcriptional regulator
MDATPPSGAAGAVDRDGVPYPILINDRVRAELTRRRLALGKSPHALAVSGLIAKQTIVSIERGTHSPTVRTLAVLCQRLGTTVEAVIVAASRATGRLVFWSNAETGFSAAIAASAPRFWPENADLDSHDGSSV